MLLVSQTSSFIKGHLDSSSPWDETSYGEKNGGQDTDILSSGIVCKNSGNWNGSVLVRTWFFFQPYEYYPQELEGFPLLRE